MSRTTIDFGIDLGTTNSAIAVQETVSPEIIKNGDQHDITPSAVHISKKGIPSVGLRAINRMSDWPDDTFLEFKRRMGSDYVYAFESSGQTRKPEELSAEILKSLKDDVLQNKHEVVESAVITVPAAFELHQCAATRMAAQLAGFKLSPLVQEPVAAALAFGFQAERQKAYWLVYDFGGGTFDAAIIKAEDGTIHVVNHGGDPFLGGSDIDKALVTKVVASRVAKEFGLKEFDWAHAGRGGRWRQAFAILKRAAEQAKIELSRREKTSIELGTLRDEKAGKNVFERFEIEDISRADLVPVAEPFIARSVRITKQVMEEKHLPNSAIERIILVGGQTLDPLFREILAAELRIKLDHSLDPFTVVARGAAVFAGTQRLDTGGTTVAVLGAEFSVDLKYRSVGVDSTPTVGGKVSGEGVRDFTGYMVQLVQEKTRWNSGKIPLSADGVFLANLYAERGERNIYQLAIYDKSGLRRKVNPDRLTYTIGAVVDEQPLINSIGVAQANNVVAWFFKKGSGLPLKKTMTDFKTVYGLRQGQSGVALRIPIVEGEIESADRNRLNGTLELRGNKIRRDLPLGSEVEVTLHIDTSRIITVKAYVPLLDEEFETRIDMKHNEPNPEELSVDCNAELKRLDDLKSKASNTGSNSAKAVLVDVEENLVREVKETLAAAEGRPDEAKKCENRLLEMKVKLDEAANALEWPAQVADARQWLEWLHGLVDQHGSKDQRNKAEKLSAEVAEAIKEVMIERLRSRIGQIQRLYWEILFEQPEFWVYQFGELEKHKETMSDHARANHLLGQGHGCVANNNINGLRNVVLQLQDLLPKEVVEAAQRGYQSGVIR